MAIKIESGVPIPPATKGGGIDWFARNGLTDLKIDQSFVLPREDANWAVTQVIINHAKKRGWKLTTRKAVDNNGQHIGKRFWRIA